MTNVHKLMISAAAAALFAVGPALASAPKPLGSTGGQGGSLGKNSSIAEDGAKFDCYSIDTKPGEELELTVKSGTFTPEIWIARGATCDSMAVQAQSEAGDIAGEASVKFKAAGGRYLVMTRANGAKQAGTYRIVVMHASDFKAEAADAGTPADAGSPADAGTPADAGDRRVALMKKQVAVRQAQLAEEARIRAEQEAAERRRQQALAEQRRREAEARAQAEANSGGGDIFGRALGGFLMGAMLGGGGEGAMDMAIAGAQAAASGGNGLEIINSIGAAVPSSGASAGAMGGAMNSMSSAPVMPNTIGGECPGMNESNYRQEALSSGDRQRKTMCGLAYEHYNIYKNSVAQSYSAADQKLSYDAYQKSVAALSQFDSETSGGGGIQQDTHGPQAPRQEAYGPNDPGTPCNAPEGTSCVTPQ